MSSGGSDSDSSELDDVVRRAKAGEGAAWARLDQEVRARFRGLVQRSLGNQAGARADQSDVLQETFLKALENFGEFRGNTFPAFCSWCVKILDSQVRLMIRRHHQPGRNLDLDQSLPEGSRVGKGFTESSGDGPSRQAIRSEEVAELLDAIGRLNDDHTTVIRLRNLHELDWDEVAECMGRNKDATRKLWERAMEKLEEEIRLGRGVNR